jgi:hypothetical protein
MQVHDGTEGHGRSRLVLQPETDDEQHALHRLYEVLTDIDRDEEALAWFTNDLGSYDDALDLDRWRSAVYDPVNERFDAGARALVVSTGLDWGGFATYRSDL